MMCNWIDQMVEGFRKLSPADQVVLLARMNKRMTPSEKKTLSAEIARDTYSGDKVRTFFGELCEEADEREEAYSSWPTNFAYSSWPTNFTEAELQRAGPKKGDYIYHYVEHVDKTFELEVLAVTSEGGLLEVRYPHFRGSYYIPAAGARREMPGRFVPSVRMEHQGMPCRVPGGGTGTLIGWEVSTMDENGYSWKQAIVRNRGTGDTMNFPLQDVEILREEADEEALVAYVKRTIGEDATINELDYDSVERRLMGPLSDMAVFDEAEPGEDFKLELTLDEYNETNMMIFFEGECPECWGTGLKSGFQSPCSKGCKVTP